MTQSRTVLPERNLDILRAIAVLGVLVNHVFDAYGSSSSFGGWFGRAGVLTFFVHTSLVLMSSMERQGTDDGWVTRFYVRRAFRIYPLAIVAILIAAGFRITHGVPVVHHPEVAPVPSPFVLAANLALVQNLVGARDILSVTWTLPVELQMYVLLPVCYVLARRDQPLSHLLKLTMVGGAIGLGIQYARRALHDNPHAFGLALRTPPNLWKLTVFEFMPCFMCGVFVYSFLRRGWKPGIPWQWWVPLIVINMCAWGLLDHYYQYNLWLQWGYCAIVAVIILSIQEIPENWLSHLGHEFAKYSYGIYLLHIIGMWVGLTVLGMLPVWVEWIVAGGVTAMLPVLAYYTIEMPGIRLGQRLTRVRVLNRP
ncbi:MAG TPA: acyltransferase [Gemmatimonadaceae bacterium]|nr:acyltransferase [Gemmatimonadaceae bacterium]